MLVALRRWGKPGEAAPLQVVLGHKVALGVLEKLWCEFSFFYRNFHCLSWREAWLGDTDKVTEKVRRSQQLEAISFPPLLCCLIKSNPMDTAYPQWAMQTPSITKPIRRVALKLGEELENDPPPPPEWWQDAPEIQPKKNSFWGRNIYSLSLTFPSGGRWVRVSFPICQPPLSQGRAVTPLVDEFGRREQDWPNHSWYLAVHVPFGWILS